MMTARLVGLTVANTRFGRRRDDSGDDLGLGIVRGRGDQAFTIEDQFQAQLLDCVLGTESAVLPVLTGEGRPPPRWEAAPLAASNPADRYSTTFMPSKQ